MTEERTETGRGPLELYSWLAPAVLAPLSFWLHWRRYDGDPGPVLVAWLVPILWAYVVPGVGTNVLQVWEFGTRLRLGRFRPHHGFVFGSATATLAWLCHGEAVRDWTGVLRLSFVLASVLGFWNLLYEVVALRAGILKVYNQPWADGQPPEAVALDYSPWFFAGFGAVYGAGLGLAELLAVRGALAGARLPAYLVAILALSIVVPVAGYRERSFRRHGHSGCRPVPRKLP